MNLQILFLYVTISHTTYQGKVNSRKRLERKRASQDISEFICINVSLKLKLYIDS